MAMLTKLFQKNTQSPKGDLDWNIKNSQAPGKLTFPCAVSASILTVPHGGMILTDLDPRVAVHYGIPSSASILTFDPIQRLLAIGTLDGRIKLIGGDNIESLLLSPKQLPFKYLESLIEFDIYEPALLMFDINFLQNQGFLASISNENEIQVWDLERRCIACNLLWESNITAFAVIYGTPFMYIGDEYGFVAVLKYDAETRKLLHLPYCIPSHLITEAAGIPVSNHQSIVGILPQPNYLSNRALIAYENGLIVLWDITEDKAVTVRGCKDLQLKDDYVLDSANDRNQDEQAEKEISSLCWVSSDGSIVAVGYVDGDILLWNLSESVTSRDQKGQKASNNVVKLQLSSSDRKLPVIVLHWCRKTTRDDSGGYLFAYGGDEIGSDEVLTILNLDWSSGIESLQCVVRVDLTLNGSFADMILVPNAGATQRCESSSLFVLSNPGQLHLYDDSSLSSLMALPERKHCISGVPYHEVVPILEPMMTIGKLKLVHIERRFTRAYPVTTQGNKWPITGGVPCQLSCAEDDNVIKRVYIAGYKDGSIRIWDATFPVLSPIFVLEPVIEGIEIVGATASISALEFFSSTSMLATGNDYGLIRLYKLGLDSDERSLHLVTETKQEVHNLQCKDGLHCTAIISVLDSSVHALQFVDFGNRLAVAFASGVILIDVNSLSVLFRTDSISGSCSSSIFLLTPYTASKPISSEDSACESAKKAMLILTGDAYMAVLDSTTGKVISSQQMHPEKLPVISLHILDGSGIPEVSSERPPLMSSRDIGAKSESGQRSSHPARDSVETKTCNSGEPTSFEQSCRDSLVFLCFEDALSLCSFGSLIKGTYKPIYKVKLEKACCWTSMFKKDGKEAGLIVVYQTGLIEIRSLPYLELLGESSLMSIVRWSFKTSMIKTLSSSDAGQIVVANGGEVAFISLFAFENDFGIPQTLPCLHDKVLEAAASAAIFSQKQKKQASVPGVWGGIIKGLKGNKEETGGVPFEDNGSLLTYLDDVFSRVPLSGPSTTISDDQEAVYLNIDDIDVDIDEPVPTPSSTQKSKIDQKDKETDREKLFQGGSSTVPEPRMRTAEEIRAKYRKTDVSASAAQAKDKLMERQEKLEKLSRRTEELQNGAQNFAEMASELAKQMEKRNKWWHI